MNDGLDTQLRAALDKRRGDWKQIAEASGISYSWLSQFARDKIPNPGYATLQKLAATLALVTPDHAAPAAEPAAAQG